MAEELNTQAAPVDAPAQPVAAPVSAQPALDPTTANATTQVPLDPGVAAQQAAQPLVLENQGVAQDIKTASNPTPPPPPPPHAKLLAMIQGLGIGLSAAGAAIGSHGREGGAPEVQQYYANQQQQKIQAQQAAQQQKNEHIQNLNTVYDTNTKQINAIMNLHTIPLQISKDQLEVTRGQQEVEAGKQASIKTEAEFRSQYGVDTTSYDKIMRGQGSAADIQNVTDFNKSKIAAAAKILPVDDPALKHAQDVMSGQTANPKDVIDAVAGVNRALALHDMVVGEQEKQADLKAKQQSSDPLYKYESDPSELVKPGAQQALSAYISDPANKGNLDGVAKAKLLITRAGIAQQHDIDLTSRKATANKNAEMLAMGGDPKKAGQALASGDITLADLKSRGSSPAQIIDAESEAKKFDPGYNASDEITGEQALKGVTNQTFYGSARSLVQQGGMLDQLKQAHDALGNTKIPGFNTVAQWTAYQAGTPELATYKQAVLGAGDDYAKVMGGGNPAQNQFNEIKDGFAAKLNNPQFDGAVNVARSAVRSQVTGRIGTNHYILKREGDILHDQTASSGKTVSLKDAMALPGSQGKTEDQVRADIVAHGHEVSQ